MKTYIAGVAFFIITQATFSDIVLIDFGNDSSFRGVGQSGPDSNGNYWNSVWSGSFYAGLVDFQNNATTINFGFSAAPGTDSFNGPAGNTSGITTNPAILNNTQIDADALGYLGGSLAAAFDYYVNSTFQIQGLNLSSTYNITFFGSHKFNVNDVTRYTIYDDSSFTNALSFADLTVGVGSAHNSNLVVTISGVSPQSNGIIYVGFAGAGGAGSGYLNAMQIEVVPEPVAALLLLFGGAILVAARHRFAMA